MKSPEDEYDRLPPQPMETFEESPKEKPTFSCRKFLLATTMFLLVFITNVCFSLLVPFFPKEARAKGASHVVIGIIFGIFELVMFVFSPIFGIIMTKVAPRYLLIGGSFYTAVITAAYGFLSMVPAGAPFIGLSIFLRILDAIGATAVTNSCFTLAWEYFPNYAMTIIGLLNTATGVGYLAGPVLGGALFEAGGFMLPFIVVGMLVLVCAAFLPWIVPRETASKKDTKKIHPISLLQLFVRPNVVLVCFITMYCGIATTFLSPIFSKMIGQFHLGSVTVVGLFYAIAAAAYSIASPLIGMVLDKWHSSAFYILLLGTFIGTWSFLFLGPCPLFHIKGTALVNGICLFFIGISAAMMSGPAFIIIGREAMRMGLPESLETNGLVSALETSSMCLGGFVGPVSAGALSDALGIPWSTSVLGFALAVTTIILAVWILVIKYKESSLSEKDVISANSVVYNETSPILKPSASG